MAVGSEPTVPCCCQHHTHTFFPAGVLGVPSGLCHTKLGSGDTAAVLLVWGAAACCSIAFARGMLRMFLCFVSEIEAKKACDWLRAAGFPQYAQLYEGESCPVWFGAGSLCLCEG
mgnify:CR=1 FL=1